VIIQTPFTTQKDIERAFASGRADFIPKPFNADEMIFKIKEQLSKA
jgi:DNA-binding response OmpR family regulator